MKRTFVIKAILLSVILLFITGNIHAAENFKIYPGEYLKYKVTFLGINLGNIEITTGQPQKFDGHDVYFSEATIKSNDDIPFVKIHAIYQSWIDKSITFSRNFTAKTLKNDDWVYDYVDFDYDKDSIKHIKKYKGKLIFEKDYSTDKKWNDGLSLFFFPRKYLTLTRNLKIPTFIEGLAATVINFNAKNIQNTEIDAVKYPVSTIYIKGYADYKGVYGLTGDFEGWFTNDEARVPVLAKLNVLVGKVTVQLVQWKRGSWKPPAAAE